MRAIKNQSFTFEFLNLNSKLEARLPTCSRFLRLEKEDVKLDPFHKKLLLHAYFQNE